MNVKKRDLVILQQGIQKVGDLFGDNVRFSYAIAKNDKLIASECEAINKTIQFTPEFAEYDAKRVELAKKFAKKNEKGEALEKNNQFVMFDVNDPVEKQQEDLKLWEEAFDGLKKEYSEVLKKRDEQVAEYNKLLDGETDVKLYMINENDLPRTITPVQLAGIISIVE